MKDNTEGSLWISLRKEVMYMEANDSVPEHSNGSPLPLWAQLLFGIISAIGGCLIVLKVVFEIYKYRYGIH